MDDHLRVALYARVSSERQADELTIQSQVAALRERIRSDGRTLDKELCFLDDGYSGATLVRPALERLRDLAVDFRRRRRGAPGGGHAGGLVDHRECRAFDLWRDVTRPGR